MKQRLFKISLILTLFITSLLANSVNTEANSILRSTVGNLEVQYQDDWHDASRDGKAYGRAGIFTINGVKQYCVEPRHTFVNGNEYVSDIDWEEWFNRMQINVNIKEKITLASYYGYGYSNRELGINREDDIWYAVTQSLIWQYIMEAQGYTAEQWAYMKPKSYSFDQMDTYINEIKANIENHNVVPNLVKISGEGMVVGNTIEIKAGQYIVLKDTNNVLPYFSFSTTTPTGVTVTKTNTTIRIETTENTSDTVVINLQKVPDQKIGESYIFYPSTDPTNQILAPLDKTNQQVNCALHIKANKLGDLLLNKTTTDGMGALGTKFLLTGPNGYQKEITITSLDGNYYIKDLPIGTYTLKEISAPSHLVLDVTEHTIVIDTNKETTINLVNQFVLVNVIVKKVDTENTKMFLEGAEFTLYNETMQPIQTKVSTKEGLATFEGLRYGKYYVKETKAPAGYTLDETIHEIIIDDKYDSRTPYEITLYNTKVINKPVTSNTQTTVTTNDTYHGDIYLLFMTASVIVFFIGWKKKVKYHA